ncbi:RHS repeat-associated core domain-containing protein [Emticicia aquatilis]|nr:RHS repeat-associated core domain-containing protein [Emticicia aquatilis]
MVGKQLAEKVNTDNWERISKSSYYALGELKTKELGCDNSTGTQKALQTVDYVKNIRGWLMSINGVENADLQDNKDLFGMRLTYDGINASNDNAEVSNTFFNGNIVKQEWNTLKNTTTGTTANGKQTYDYKYDRLNRLMEANFVGSLTEGLSVKMYDITNPLRNYDLNGNIRYLKRTKAGVTTPMDELIYSYTANQLNKVDDNGDVNQLFKDRAYATDYLYDAAGNMKQDKNKDLTIQYNHLNLPGEMTRDDGSSGFRKSNSTDNNGNIKHYYAGDAKVRMEIYYLNTGVIKKAYDYVAGMVYIQEGQIGPKTLDFVPSHEGRALLTRKVLNTPTDPEEGDKFRYEYSLKDHLGNLRVSCRCGEPKRNASGTIIPEGTVGAGIEALAVVQENHYDPWGLSFGVNTEVQANELTNKYQYNGKEEIKDLDIGLYEYGYRWYDATIARFVQVDPLAEKYSYKSEFDYAENSPISGVDLDGLEFYYAADGRFLNQGSDKNNKDVYSQRATGEKRTISITTYAEGGQEIVTDVEADVYENVKVSSNHDEFLKFAGLVFNEDPSTKEAAFATGSAVINYLNFRNENKIKTTLADLLNGRFSSAKKDFTVDNKNDKKKNSIAAVINALSGGFDYSNGATHWDGFDFAMKGFDHVKPTNQGVDIAEDHFNQFKLAWPSSLLRAYSQNKNATFSSNLTSGIHEATGSNKGRVLYKSAAVVGKTIFWKPNKDAKQNAGYSWKYY